MSPRSSEQNQAIRQDRQRQLMATAVELFARNGYDNTGTEAIARAAGMSHGALFTYFPTKEALFRAAVATPLAPTVKLIEELLGSQTSPPARVRALARIILTSFAQEEPYLALIQYVMRLRLRFSELSAEIGEFIDAVLTLLERVIQEGQEQRVFLPGDAREMAFYFYALIQGCSLMHGTRIDTAVEMAMRLLCVPTQPDCAERGE